MPISKEAETKVPFPATLFGIGVNLGLQNRNFARAANIATTNIRYGIEISDSSFIQTQQFALSHIFISAHDTKI